LREQNTHLKDQFNHVQHRLETKLQDTMLILEKAHTENERQKTEFDQLIKQSKDEAAIHLAETQSRIDAEKESILRHREYELQKWQEQLGELEGKNRLLIDMKSQLDESVLELTQSNQGMQNELHRVVSELETLRSSHYASECIRLEHERELENHHIQVATLEQQLQEKNEHMQRIKESLNTMQEQKMKTEEALELYKTQNLRLEDALKKSKDEISKGNDIIKKLQSDFKEAKSKLKLKTVIASQQEKQLEDRQRAMDALVRESSDLKNQVTLKDQELEQLNLQLKSTIKKLDESKQIIETNENGMSFKDVY
jgi:spindle assembly abnormal protein 6